MNIRRVGVAAAAVVLAVTAAGCGNQDAGAAAASAEPSVSPTPESLLLEGAYDACRSGEDGKTLTLGDEGRTLIIDTRSEYGPMGGLVCALAELDTSQAIVAQMESTTAMMGVQSGTDGDLAYQWSYHPDNGMNMVITDQGDSD